jgi:hypothetical protein
VSVPFLVAITPKDLVNCLRILVCSSSCFHSISILQPPINFTTSLHYVAQIGHRTRFGLLYPCTPNRLRLVLVTREVGLSFMSLKENLFRSQAIQPLVA